MKLDFSQKSFYSIFNTIIKMFYFTLTSFIHQFIYNQQ